MIHGISRFHIAFLKTNVILVYLFSDFCVKAAIVTSLEHGITAASARMGLIFAQDVIHLASFRKGK